MSQRDTKYRQNKFKEWKNKVRKHLPELVIKFYQAKLDGVYIPYEKERTLGRVIEGINDPYYTIMKPSGERMDIMSQISAEIMLEILTEETFKFVNTLK